MAMMMMIVCKRVKNNCAKLSLSFSFGLGSSSSAGWVGFFQ